MGSLYRSQWGYCTWGWLVTGAVWWYKDLCTWTTPIYPSTCLHPKPLVPRLKFFSLQILVHPARPFSTAHESVYILIYTTSPSTQSMARRST